MTYTIHTGDCLNVMKTLEENSVDSIITDPPYGLKFMKKNWDYGVPGIPFWKETLRVAKPGAILFAFGGTRTYHRLACAIEDAGWIIRDMFDWWYGSGFPKSLNIAKAMDKAAGVKPIGEKHPSLGMANNEQWNELNRQLIMPPLQTEDAKKWDGWGTAAKPAHEPICLAMKPLDGNYIENAKKWGVAGLWIDGARIGDDVVTINTFDDGAKPFGGGAGHEYTSRESKGRWPANVILDEVAAAMLDQQSGQLSSGNMKAGTERRNREGWSGDMPSETGSAVIGDSGGASRFFYVAKASKAERNEGLEGEEKRETGGGGLNHEELGRKYGSIKGTHRNHHPTVKPVALMRWLCNLTRTPTGGVVLDPFMGSGTTGVAAIQAGRSFIGIDLSEEYCQIAEGRISHAHRWKQDEEAAPTGVTVEEHRSGQLGLFD